MERRDRVRWEPGFCKTEKVKIEEFKFTSNTISLIADRTSILQTKTKTFTRKCSMRENESMSRK